MALRLNQKAYDHARELIDAGRVVKDEPHAWSEAQPTADVQNEYIRAHGFPKYGTWFLGINEDEPEDTKARYAFPYGDFHEVRRSGVLAAEHRAGQYKHVDIEKAAAGLYRRIKATE